MISISAHQISDGIKLKEFKSAYTGQLNFSDSDELFYSTAKDQFVYIFKYGVVCYANYDDIAKTNFNSLLLNFCKNPQNSGICEEFTIEIDPEKYIVGYNNLTINKITEDSVRLAMLYVSQSVALDYYTIQAEELMENTNFFIQKLEDTGRIATKGNNLLRFIGKTLNLRNKIIENLYIFDTHPVAWEDEFLNKLENDLSKVFDLKQRYRNVSENLSIVKENLDLFKDIMQYKKSSFIEWTIVLLILVEVVALLIEKLT